MQSKKEWIYLLLLILVTVLALAVNQFTYTIYNLNLYEYIKYSQDFTEEELSYLKGKKILSYASDNNAPPFSFQDKYTGIYKGFVLDYASALSIELNTEIEFVPKVWDEAIQSVVSGEADMIELFPSEDRKNFLLFTDSIYKLRAIIMTRSNEQAITKASDLSGHKVAVEAGDFANEYIFNNIPNVEIINTVDYLESVNKLLSGDVDAIIGDEPILIYFMGNLSIEDKVSILPKPIYEHDICIGVTKTEDILVNILNKGILDLKKSDFAPKIQQKWFGLSAPVHQDRLNAQIMFLMIVVLMFLAIAAASISIWSYILKMRVVMRTKELTESRNDLQMTFDAISDFLIVINHNGFIENVNQSFSDFLKKDKMDIIGSNCNEVILLKNISFHNNETNNEIALSGRHYNYYISPFASGENRILISIEDNTNEIISRTQMLQQNKMIAVGQLAAGLAHEIRNPLGIIRNYSYVLKTKLINQDQVAEKAIVSIESSVLRASKMVENLLNFSRISNDNNCLLLKDTINDIVALEKKAIEDKKIELIINCDESIEFCTKTESLTHVILNLLSNAVDAVPIGGRIIIECYVEDNYLYVNFYDNGVGIEEHNLEYIFNPFYTTKKAGKGTGLGLYIVYNELQKINGEIIVESTIGKGTIFKLKFKLKEDTND